MAPTDDDRGYDPRRREFFRTFGRQSVRNAGAMIGAVGELRRVGSDATRELLDMDRPQQQPKLPPAIPSPAPVGRAAAFRSAYVVTEDGLELLDQRDLPGATTTVTVREPSEIASAIRLGVVNAGPVLGEVCAYGLALAIADAADRSPASRDLVWRAAADTLTAARSDVHAVAYAVRRVAGAYDHATTPRDDHDPAELAAALRSEADAIASDGALAHAALGRAAAAFIASARAAKAEVRADEPLQLLMHGDMGPLSSGLVGTGTSIVQSLLMLGHAVHVWVTEAAPGLEGSRIASLQLLQSDVAHTVVPDTAVAWLVSARRLDGALLRGDNVCANGDTAALVGSANVAVICRSAGIPVYVVAPPSAIDPELSDGRTLATELRSPAEAAARTDASSSAPRPALFGSRLSPASDTIPASLIDGYLTESGFTPEVRA